MMSWWLILSLLCRLLGLAAWAESFLKKHQVIVQARKDANAPVTNEEEIDDFGRW
jgi:hypothetical protein